MQKTLVLALFMLGATGALAQNSQFAVVQKAPKSSRGASGVTACIYQTLDLAYHAAVSFDASHDGIYRIEAYVFENSLVCDTNSQFVAGDLSLSAGPSIVYLTNDLPPGTQLSIFWAQIGDYFGSTCDGYDVPTSPPPCQT